jgi:hypothetical protein
MSSTSRLTGAYDAMIRSHRTKSRSRLPASTRKTLRIARNVSRLRLDSTARGSTTVRTTDPMVSATMATPATNTTTRRLPSKLALPSLAPRRAVWQAACSTVTAAAPG